MLNADVYQAEWKRQQYLTHCSITSLQCKQRSSTGEQVTSVTWSMRRQKREPVKQVMRWQKYTYVVVSKFKLCNQAK